MTGRNHPTAGQSREAKSSGALVASTLGAREFRRRAALVVRCVDCGGQAIVHVTYVDARPMVWHRGWGYLWLDLSWIWRAFCRAGHDHVLRRDDIVARLPAHGAPSDEWRVSHRPE